MKRRASPLGFRGGRIEITASSERQPPDSLPLSVTRRPSTTCCDTPPTIRLLLCKERNRVIVEYALQDSPWPLGVATYRRLPDETKANLQTLEELEAQLATFDASPPPDEPASRPNPRRKRKRETDR